MVCNKICSAFIFMCCFIQSPGLFAVDSILGKTVNQFNFYTQSTGDAEFHELDRQLTFILDDYIPGESQRATAYNLKVDVNGRERIGINNALPEP